MQVKDIMSTPAVTCGTDDTTNRAAQLMWENDCGAIPVVGSGGKLAGIVTDRDICMAAYIKGQPLRGIQVADIMSRQVVSCRAEDDLAQVGSQLGRSRIRRVPVVDAEDRPIGMLTLNDIARSAARVDARKAGVSSDGFVQTMAAICSPRGRQLKTAKSKA